MGFKKGDPLAREAAMKSHEVYRSKPKAERKPRGFAANPELAKYYAPIGGRISKRTKKEAS